MDIKEKDEVEITDSNLKDFLEQDLKNLEFILNESDESKMDLTPVPISNYKKIKNKNKINKNL